MLSIQLPATSTKVAVATRSRRERLEHVRHVVAVAVSAAVIAVSLLGWTPGTTAAVLVVVGAVITGLPHGALDVVVGPSLTSRPRFFGTYLVAIGLVVAMWFVAPLFSLCAFFVASWFHFARGDAEHHERLGRSRSLLGISTAGCAIGIPLAIHGEHVTPLVTDLLLGSARPSSTQIALVGALIAVPAVLAGAVAAVAAVRARHTAALIELAVIAACAVAVHPLVSFALYFALWHSPRHLIERDVDLDAVTPTLAATAATLVAAAFVWRFAEPSLAVATQVIFIGLAALTGPHLVVTELARLRDGRRAMRERRIRSDAAQRSGGSGTSTSRTYNSQ